MRKALIAAAILVAISPVASAQKSVTADPLLTRRGWEVGGQFSEYRYEEPSVGVKIWGPRVGIIGAYTYASASHWFFKIDGRNTFGSLNYEGSGTQDSIPDWIFETRAVLGKDFLARSGGFLRRLCRFTRWLRAFWLSVGSHTLGAAQV